ncbi:MAG TPA: FecR domain-containing protein [Puia sp.]|nr:FecR domain-containing protein [Puia sp.]
MEENEYIKGLILKHFNQEASPSEQSELQQWLAADPQRRQNYQDLEKIWQDSGTALQGRVFDKDAAWVKVESRLMHIADGKESTTPAEVRPLLISKKRKWMAAAAILVLASAGGWYFGRKVESPSRMIRAQNADQQVTLPDGSIAYLRKGATIKYEKPVNGRMAELNGEAFFQLAHNAGTPFRIGAGQAIIEDIGTSFLVKDLEGVTEVMVVTGKIRFIDRLHSLNNIVLLSGERAVLKEDKFIKSALTDSNFMAWRTGVLNFRGTPLDQAAQAIGDFYRLSVRLAPDLEREAGKIGVTARFERQPLEEVLEEMKLTTGLRIIHEKDTLFFRRP